MPETSPTRSAQRTETAQSKEQRPWRSLPHDSRGEKAAIDAEDLARHVARAFLVEKEGDHGRDFLRLGIAAKRHAALEGGAALGPMQRAHHRRVDGPGRDG